MSKTRVAILGGGLSGVVTAFYLSAPEQRGKYDITIYQLGWRLGGKCATGRNQDHGDRVQEHGLHVFMGAYQNAFRMVQEAYAEARNRPFEKWEDVFTRQDWLTLMDKENAYASPWVMKVPVMPGTPGIDRAPDLWGRMAQVLEWIESELLGTHGKTFSSHPDLSALSWWRRILTRLLLGVQHLVPQAASVLVRDALELVQLLVEDPRKHGSHHHGLLAELLAGLRSWIQRRARPLLEKDDELRHFWVCADLGLSSLIGSLRDGLLFDPEANLERVNQLDYREWLRSHGADEISLQSALIRSLYDLIFAYPQGDWTGPGEVEAGTMVVSLMNTATYQGSIIWKFNSATGDAIVQPIYEVLKQRGVKVEFFHRVDRLVPSADGSEIAAVEIGRQVELAGETYHPLRTIEFADRPAMHVWPDRPLYRQIKDGEKLEASGADLESHWTDWQDPLPPLVLKSGDDYDALVLAIPPAAHATICRDLISQKSEWRRFNTTIRSTATQSLQTWMDKTEKGLGWDKPSLVGAYDKVNLNTWCDISEVLATESWPKESGVCSEQIMCGPLPCKDTLPPSSDHEYPARQQAIVDQLADDFLNGDGSYFWHREFGPGGPDKGTILSRYSRANIDPSERYTLTVRGSTRHRMTASGSTYSNLYLTGDWIQNGQNLGSFEATTISGMLASHAISKFPTDIMGVDAEALTRAEYPQKPADGPGLFVKHHGMSTFPGTITLNNTTMWAFLLDADYDLMAGYCHRMFDEPSGGAVKVRPMGSTMMMSIVDILTGRFVDEPQMGWSPERELTFWIPAVRVEKRGGKEVATHFDMVMPYLVLDNPVAIASGREIFGYAKQKGWITLPGDEGNNDGALSVDLFATKAFGKGAQQARHRLLTLSSPGEEDSGILGKVGSFGEAAKALFHHLGARKGGWHNSLGLDLEIIGDALYRRVPQLFLKQFRDVHDGNRACYQAITEAMGEVTKFDAFPKLVTFDMGLDHLDSSPVASDFGIAPRQKVRGVRIAYDMTILPGRVLWEG
ncbi:NAD(P)-binding protein [Qipengyuania gaetbuli]|uniref:NAD(P)-binding protein n=1 Tax=Qipengyuania gaetbuli TaxID=266952 RepID=UPI001C991CBA|nr:NAD(P)-binding protein [Qipengyuania gaetbuli]MBY6014211.1 NAD(P)-binding protein [Qipengyuania gaetbuli]